MIPDWANQIVNTQIREILRYPEFQGKRYPNVEWTTFSKIPRRYGDYDLCTNTIRLNVKLIKMRVGALEEVITHEMCHMIYQNHRKEFKTLLNKMYPNRSNKHQARYTI